MTKWRVIVHAPGVLALASLIIIACRDAVGPTLDPTGMDQAFGVKPPPPKGDDEPRPARFRLTGGGRVDARDHMGNDKNTPESRDFATFGFQARPTGTNTTDGSGQFTWVEHNPAAPGGGFSFHGRVDFFSTPIDGSSADDCGRFGGSDGSLHARDGTRATVSFTVEHACDIDEPGVGVDHIRVRIDFGGYTRHGLLSGGNIQKHRIN